MHCTHAHTQILIKILWPFPNCLNQPNGGVGDWGGSVSVSHTNIHTHIKFRIARNTKVAYQETPVNFTSQMLLRRLSAQKVSNVSPEQVRHTERVSKYIMKWDIIAQIFKNLCWEIIEFIFFYCLWWFFWNSTLEKNLTKSFNSLSIEPHCFLWETIETLKRFFFCTGNVRILFVGDSVIRATGSTLSTFISRCLILPSIYCSACIHFPVCLSLSLLQL